MDGLSKVTERVMMKKFAIVGVIVAVLTGTITAAVIFGHLQSEVQGLRREVGKFQTDVNRNQETLAGMREEVGELRGRIKANFNKYKSHAETLGLLPGKDTVNVVKKATPRYKWKRIGRGDITRNDLCRPTSGSTPDSRRCSLETRGLGVVCPDDDKVCHYKNVTAAAVANGGGKHPGPVYECVYE